MKSCIDVTGIYIEFLVRKKMVIKQFVTLDKNSNYYKEIPITYNKSNRLVDLGSKMAEPRQNSNRNDFMSVVKYNHSSFTRKKSHSI